MALEENCLVWCVDWAIGKFMPRSAGLSRTYPEGVLEGGLGELGIGLKLKKALGFWPLPVLRRV